MAVCSVQPADVDSQTHLPASHDAAVGTIEVHPVPSPVPITGPTTFSTLTTSHSRVHQSGHSGTTQGPPWTVTVGTALEVPVTETVTVTEFNQSVLFTSVASDTTSFENWSTVSARSVPSDMTPAVSRDILTGYKLQCKDLACSSICACSDEGNLKCRPGPLDGLDCPVDCKCLKTTTSSGEPGIPTPTTPPVATHSVPSDTPAVSSNVPAKYKVQCTSPACFSNCHCSDQGKLQCGPAPMTAPNCGKDCFCVDITTTTKLPSLLIPTTPPAAAQTEPQKRAEWSSSSCRPKVDVCSTSTTSSTADSMTLPFTTPNSMVEKVGTPVSLEKSTTTRSLPWMSTTPQV